jgi:prepilin-type N-terminal cleavage/methylation domain-containing protein
MSLHKAIRRKNPQSGFTMIETLAAIVVLSIGLVGMAVLMSNMMTGGARSRYMSNAAMLASEELENLQRFSAGPDPTDQTGADPEIAVTSGSIVGSLTSDLTATVTSGGVTQVVDYFDSIQLSSTGGAVSETYSGKDGAGNTNYKTITHLPDGTTTTVTTTSAPTPAPDTLVYKRRWTIEKDSPVPGVRRVTVLVTLTNPGVAKAVTFQMSTVRP